MKAYGYSDIGQKREQNEDRIYYAYNDAHCFLGVVCDGIGGQNAGDVASTIAISKMKEAFEKNPLFTSDEAVFVWLNEQISQANDAIFVEASSSLAYKGMGTTISGILITSKDCAYLFNAGDSRVYGYYDQLQQLSVDHSFVNDLVLRGELTKEEAQYHPKRNMLTNALGVWDRVKVDIAKIPSEYHALMVSSDGLHDYVPHSLMEEVLGSELGTKQKVEKLIALANHAGGLDNISVVLAEKEVEHE